MKKYQFVQAVYYYYEVEAETEQEAWEKTADIDLASSYDTVVGDWVDATRYDEEITA